MLGGSANSMAKVEYNIASDTWSTLPDLPFRLQNGACLTTDMPGKFWKVTNVSSPSHYVILSRWLLPLWTRVRQEQSWFLEVHIWNGQCGGMSAELPGAFSANDRDKLFCQMNVKSYTRVTMCGSWIILVYTGRIECNMWILLCHIARLSSLHHWCRVNRSKDSSRYHRRAEGMSNRLVLWSRATYIWCK